MRTPPTLAGDRILAGAIEDPSVLFRFEVWAYRQLSREELGMTFQLWARQRDRRRSLKNKTIQVIANHGIEPGL